MGRRLCRLTRPKSPGRSARLRSSPLRRGESVSSAPGDSRSRGQFRHGEGGGDRCHRTDPNGSRAPSRSCRRGSSDIGLIAANTSKR